MYFPSNTNFLHVANKDDRTAMHVAELLTGAKFTVEDSDGGTVLLSCEGVGYTA